MWRQSLRAIDCRTSVVEWTGVEPVGRDISLVIQRLSLFATMVKGNRTPHRTVRTPDSNRLPYPHSMERSTVSNGVPGQPGAACDRVPTASSCLGQMYITCCTSPLWQDSNLRQQLRRLVLYPLSYKGWYNIRLCGPSAGPAQQPASVSLHLREPASTRRTGRSVGQPGPRCA